MVTLDDRLNQAMALRAQGYNCAQCVMLTFSDRYRDRVNDDAIAAVSCAFGSGVCGTGHICGAASAMTAVISLMKFHTPADKKDVFAEGHELIRRFSEVQSGKTDCRELKSPGGKPCTVLITDAVNILQAYLSEKDAH